MPVPRSARADKRRRAEAAGVARRLPKHRMRSLGWTRPSRRYQRLPDVVECCSLWPPLHVAACRHRGLRKRQTPCDGRSRRPPLPPRIRAATTPWQGHTARPQRHLTLRWPLETRRIIHAQPGECICRPVPSTAARRTRSQCGSYERSRAPGAQQRRTSRSVDEPTPTPRTDAQTRARLDHGVRITYREESCQRPYRGQHGLAWATDDLAGLEQELLGIVRGRSCQSPLRSAPQHGRRRHDEKGL